jgi:hypothetical protein
MSHAFDSGYGASPFRELVAEYPGDDIYPQQDFRTEWGPIFHRGRLDGSARLLAIGQDPGQHESFVRRILVGEAGQRSQGFLAKMGLDRSYVMINTFLYSVYGQGGGDKHKSDPKIAAYRNAWLEALIGQDKVQAVVAFGSLAAAAWSQYTATPAGAASKALPYFHVTHPTAPSSSAHDPAGVAAATKAMLAGWNTALEKLRPIVTPDTQRPFVPYGDDFAPGDLVEVPELDLPAGLPSWMRGLDGWAARTGATAPEKRATLTVKVPAGALP